VPAPFSLLARVRQAAVATTNVLVWAACLRSPLLLVSSVVLEAGSPVLLLLGRRLITMHGEAFARQLFSEYLASRSGE